MNDSDAAPSNRLKLKLELTIGGKSSLIEAGDIKAFSFDLGLEGFRASAEFWVIRASLLETDDLIGNFATRSEIEVEATLDRMFDEPGETTTPLVLKGRVVQRAVVERSFPDIDGNPVMRRLYSIAFVDSAAALWSQHFPAFLGIDTTLKEVVEAQTVDGVTVTSSWADYEAKLPQCAFCLGPMSFLDWLRWWLDTHNAFLLYDSASAAYEFVDQKPRDGEPTEIPEEDCREIRWVLPEPPRAVVRVVNGSTEVAQATNQGTNADALTGLNHDVLIRSPLGNAGADRLTLDQARFKGRDVQVHGKFAGFPTVSLFPGMLVKFDDALSTEALAKDPTWRVLRLQLSAVATSQDPSDDTGDDSNVYEAQYRFELETADEPVWKRASYSAPVFPFQVEGTIVSEQGEAEEGTYQSYQDETTMLPVYKVKIPLFDVTLAVPYDRQAMPGHFYFPAYKDERVLIDVGSTSSVIAQFLDWRPGAKLPQDTQGNHLLLGKRDTDETSMNHVYEDGNPALRIDRTHGQDRQTVTIEEGLIRFETREDEAE